MSKPHYNVAAGIIVKPASETSDGTERIFCAQRPGPKPGKEQNETHFKWEFPGGKIEEGETPQAALAREVQEELGAKIIVGEPLMTVEYEYKTFAVTLRVFFCRLANQNETISLNEHLACKWLSRDELGSVEWAPADAPILEALRGRRS